jgi:Tol biopolymer transport system component
MQLGLRTAPYLATNPLPFQYSSTIHEEQASWSPMSDSLVYVETPVAGGNPKLYLRAVNGGTKMQIAASTEVQSAPEWSPRGDKILFSQTRALDPYEDVYVLDRPSGSLTLLTSGLNGVETCGTFQPNGQRIAYVLHRADELGVLQDWEIRLVGVDASNDALLVSRRSGANICSPRWTPDGQWLYFTANDSLYAVGVGTSSHGQVVSRSALMDSVTSFDFSMTDGTLLVEEPGLATLPSICTDFFLIDPPDTTEEVAHPFRRLALRDTVRKLTEPIFYQAGASYSNPRLSPDGTRVAFTRDTCPVGGEGGVRVGSAGRV